MLSFIYTYVANILYICKSLGWDWN